MGQSFLQCSNPCSNPNLTEDNTTICYFKQTKHHFNRKTQSLTLQQNESWHKIIQNTTCKKLRYLRISQCLINSANVEAMLGENWEQLRVLVFVNNEVGSDNLGVVFSELELPRISRMEIKQQIEDETIDKILKKYLHQLKHLLLTDCKLSSLALQALPQHQTSQLKTLKLNFNHIGSSGAKLISKAALPQLRELNLHQCDIGDEGVKALCKGKWDKLEILAMGKNNISLNAYWMLYTLGTKKLKQVFIYYQQKLTCLLFFTKFESPSFIVRNYASNREMSKTLNKIWNRRQLLPKKYNNARLTDKYEADREEFNLNTMGIW